MPDCPVQLHVGSFYASCVPVHNIRTFFAVESIVHWKFGINRQVVEISTSKSIRRSSIYAILDGMQLESLH